MIKYICDTCGQEVVPDEAIGPGVLVKDATGTKLGKEYKYDDGSQSSGLTLTISVERSGSEHFCLACMWKALDRMMDTYAPKTIDPVTPDPNALAERMMAERQMEADLAEMKYGPESVQWPAGWPTGKVTVEVTREETNPGTEGSDTQLLELYAEGDLPTPSPDERTGQEDDGLDPSDNYIPNFDDIVAPPGAGHRTADQQREIIRKFIDTRPGWQYRSTANGI